MKKRIVSIAVIVLVCVVPFLCIGATGTVTKPVKGLLTSKTVYPVGPYMAYKWSYEASGTQATDDTATIPIKGVIRGIKSIDTGLTGGFTAKLLTSGGYDALEGNGADIQTGNNYLFPVDPHGGGPVVLDSTADGEYYLDISEAGDGDTGDFIIYVQEEK